MNGQITVSNASKTIVKIAKDKQHAEQMVKHLSAVFGEQFNIGVKLDNWAQNYDK